MTTETETIWRISADIGKGWPLCTGRERKVRRFASEKAATDWLATIYAMPGHHRLVSIGFARVEYTMTSLGERPAFTDLPDVACGGCGVNLGAPDAPTYEPVCPDCGSRARFLDRSRNDE